MGIGGKTERRVVGKERAVITKNRVRLVGGAWSIGSAIPDVIAVSAEAGGDAAVGVEEGRRIGTGESGGRGCAAAGNDWVEESTAVGGVGAEEGCTISEG
jgi:hypothetical protein